MRFTVNRYFLLTLSMVFVVSLFLIVNNPKSDETSPLPRSYVQRDLQTLVGNVQRPNGIGWFNNRLYTVCSGDWTMYDIDAQTGATEVYLSGIRDAHTLHIESDNKDAFEIWVPDFGGNQLYKVENNRTQMTVIAQNLNGPWGIDRLDDTHLIVSSLRANTIDSISTSGVVVTLLTDMRSPTGITRDGDFIYFANNGSARRAIEWTTVDRISNGNLQPLVVGVQNTGDLVLAGDGYLYFTYALGTRGVIGRVNPEVCRDGGCTNEDVEIVVYTELPAPLAGLSISDDMELFFHAIYRPEIYHIRLYDTEIQ